MSTKSLAKILKNDLGPMSFGGFLKAARTMKDLTQKEMADLIKISKANLCDIEKGRQYVSIEQAAKIAKVCGLSDILAVECAIQDSLRRAGLKMKVEIKKIA